MSTGYFYDLTHPGNGKMSSFNVTVNDEEQCVMTKLDNDGKPCDFVVFDDVECLVDRIAEDEAGEGGYSQVLCYRASGYTCQFLFELKTWHDVACLLNGPDGKNKWVMYGRWIQADTAGYLEQKDGKFFVTELGKKLDAMQAALGEDE